MDSGVQGDTQTSKSKYKVRIDLSEIISYLAGNQSISIIVFISKTPSKV